MADPRNSRDVPTSGLGSVPARPTYPQPGPLRPGGLLAGALQRGSLPRTPLHRSEPARSRSAHMRRVPRSRLPSRREVRPCSQRRSDARLPRSARHGNWDRKQRRRCSAQPNPLTDGAQDPLVVNLRCCMRSKLRNLSKGLMPILTKGEDGRALPRQADGRTGCE